MTVLLGLVLLVPILLACLWLATAAVQAVVGEEAVGQVKRLARALVRRAARSLPPEERDTFIRDVLAELRSEELGDRPLSQLLLALDVWAHSAELRPRSRELARVFRRRVGSTFAWLGGADLRVLAQLPGERSFAILLGASVLWGGIFSGQAFAFLLTERMSSSTATGATVGVFAGVLVIAIERLVLAVGSATWSRRSWAPFLWALLLQLMLGYLVAAAAQMVMLQPVMVEPSVLGDGLSPQQHKVVLTMLEGIREMAWLQQRDPLLAGFLNLVLMANVCLPSIALLLRRLAGRRLVADLPPRQTK